MNENELETEARNFKEAYEGVRDEIGKVIVGQERVVEASLTALIGGGHVLLEGVPGLGKTMLVRAMSEALDLNFNRIQFTPDLMPADIIGTNIMNTDAGGNYSFEFRQAPIFTQLLLADEINRATPKTQSALLETMQETSVTAGGHTYHLDPPFFVMATQNPIEQEGTYPLPEAQLDRFMFKIRVPFVNRAELNEIINRTTLKQSTPVLKILNAAKIMQLREILDKVVVADPIKDFAVRLVLATHPETPYASEPVKKLVRWGASPRAVQALIRASRVRALAEGRAHISYDDVRHYAIDVLQHRVLLNYDGQAEGEDVGQIISQTVETLPEEG